MAIIMERRLLLYTGGGAAAAPSLSAGLTVRDGRTGGGRVKMEWPRGAAAARIHLDWPAAPVAALPRGAGGSRATRGSDHDDGGGGGGGSGDSPSISGKSPGRSEEAD